jgi:hypothetical protein
MERIYNHSIKLGFKPEAARIIEGRLAGLTNLCINQTRAREVLERAYVTHLNNITFSDEQLEVFVKTVGRAVRFPDWIETEDELGVTFKEAKEMRADGSFTEEEYQDFVREFNEYAESTRSQREEEVLSELERGNFFGILKAVARRNIQPSPGYREPPVIVISTPFGGQPGYKRRMRRK